MSGEQKPNCNQQTAHSPRSDIDTSCATPPPQDFSIFYENTVPEDSSTTETGCEKPPLGEDDFETLKRMLEEYKAHRMDFTRLPRRPRFIGSRVNTGIAVNAELRNRALDRAKADPDGTGGGNLSALIELLLWTFLGCPEDVIDRGPVPRSDP